MSDLSRKFALLGGSLKHTMSPPIHSRLFELKGRDFSYEVIEANAEELDGKAEYLNSIGGYNITIPHKIGIIDRIDSLDESARRYNSVNCVLNKDGKSTGYNTDCDGFLQSVRAMGAKLDGSTLLVGCGGVGRMMAIELALAGACLDIAVLESDIPLAEQVKKEILSMRENAIINIFTVDKIPEKNYNLLANATPVGMYPRVDGCPVSDEIIERCDSVFDVIYNPRETLLIKKAKAMGKNVSGGMAMLVWQAVSAHTIWDGDVYTDEEVGKIIEEMEITVEKNFK